MTDPFWPPPESPLTPETFEPFTCAVCDNDVSANRFPNLNLETCSCGLSGTSLNHPEETSVDMVRSPGQKAVIMEALRAPTRSSADHRKRVQYKEIEEIEWIDEEEYGSQNGMDQEDSNHESPIHNSFAMAIYLSKFSAQERLFLSSYNLDLDLGFDPQVDDIPTTMTATSAFIEPPSPSPMPLTFSILVSSQPQNQTHHSGNLLTSSTHATCASESVHSSYSSLSSWHSSCPEDSDDLVWTGGWQDDVVTTPLEMSWPPALIEGVLFGGDA